MILGIGIDSVEIKRFALWDTKSTKQLLRIYSQQELSYCLNTPTKSAQRFAARFAAKEAFYKAFHTATSTSRLPLFTVCSNIEVIALENGAVTLRVNWDYFRGKEGIKLPAVVNTHLSLTHTDQSATAFVIIESA